MGLREGDWRWERRKECDLFADFHLFSIIKHVLPMQRTSSPDLRLTHRPSNLVSSRLWSMCVKASDANIVILSRLLWLLSPHFLRSFNEIPLFNSSNSNLHSKASRFFRPRKLLLWRRTHKSWEIRNIFYDHFPASEFTARVFCSFLFG